MKVKVIYPFTYRGQLRELGAMVEIPDERLEYFTSQKLVEAVDDAPQTRGTGQTGTGYGGE